ncbi:hypothetical protein [Brazilian marseillevirus]|uniref:hypothetical protein n=1 Tax=Brazilian marseillevirus TaxID=1813599 RepID=UPI0007836302|nr:hypothetical protein A3303_gp008 [Brazilian marseillevirus]AMQ10516.1 hypothetical protein [Brazilian marseillevirus]
MQETFIYDGKKHVSLDGSITYLGVNRWILDSIAEFLWNEHQESLKWREDGMEKFVAFLDEEKAYIEGILEDPLSIRLISKGTSQNFVGEDLHSLHETIGELLIERTLQ